MRPIRVNWPNGIGIIGSLEFSVAERTWLATKSLAGDGGLRVTVEADVRSMLVKPSEQTRRTGAT